MSRIGEFLSAHIGYRGSALLAFGFIDLVYAISLATAPPGAMENNVTYRWFAVVAPLWVWAIGWAAAGSVCVGSAFNAHDRYGFTAAIGIKVIWAGGVITGWVMDDVPLGGAGLWLGLTFLVWRIAGWPEPVLVGKDLES